MKIASMVALTAVLLGGCAVVPIGYDDGYYHGYYRDRYYDGRYDRGYWHHDGWHGRYSDDRAYFPDRDHGE